MKLFVFLVFFSFLNLSFAYAGPQKALKKGFIKNDAGEKCWYAQEFQDGIKYFYKDLTQNIGVIVFDDSLCMSKSDFDFSVNKMAINNIISRWYSHDDADFKTRVDEMFEGSRGQIKGRCIQSNMYQYIGIAVDYIIKENSIVRVVHGDSNGECN